MRSPLQEIRERGSRSKQFDDKDWIELHHDFMVCYGWIPLTEFKALPIPTLLSLNQLVQKEKKYKYEEMRALFTLTMSMAKGYKPKL